MLIITKKINECLDKKDINRHKLCLFIDYKPGSLYKMINGEDKFPDYVIEKIAPILEVSVDEIQGWIVADKYSKEILELAVKAKKEKQNNKRILTSKIDEILQSKNLSRTALSKVIDYSQGRLNEIIIGKKTMSKSVLNKLSTALEMPETEITSWTVADKYSLQTLETAINVF